LLLLLLLLLLQELAWWSLPVCMMISFLLFGIEEIGMQIEEPFGILALDVSGGMTGCSCVLTCITCLQQLHCSTHCVIKVTEL
jgi:predicted membrane chloride channel (bestrophin family)